MPGYTQRAIIVARPAFAAAANNAAKTVDTVGGERTFTVPLRLAGDATNTIRAYWCSWAMKPAEVAAVRAALQAGGAAASDVAVITAAQIGSFVFPAGAKCAVFDAREGVGWTPADVLAALGLETLPDPSGT